MASLQKEQNSQNEFKHALSGWRTRTIVGASVTDGTGSMAQG